MQQKSYWDPKGILDKISFEEIISQEFEETNEISNWFNEFNHADNGYQPEKLVGLGHYQVDEWVASQYITLVRKKDWWGANLFWVLGKHGPEIPQIITNKSNAFKEGPKKIQNIYK